MILQVSSAIIDNKIDQLRSEIDTKIEQLRPELENKVEKPELENKVNQLKSGIRE